MKIETYSCDSCKNDLTETDNTIDYRLVLKQERIPSAGGVTTLLMRHPLIDSDKHFCSMDCLKEWINPTDPTEKIMEQVAFEEANMRRMAGLPNR